VNIKIDEKKWKKVGWVAIVLFTIKGVITTSIILYALYYGLKD